MKDPVVSEKSIENVDDKQPINSPLEPLAQGS